MRENSFERLGVCFEKKGNTSSDDSDENGRLEKYRRSEKVGSFEVIHTEGYYGGVGARDRVT